MAFTNGPRNIVLIAVLCAPILCQQHLQSTRLNLVQIGNQYYRRDEYMHYYYSSYYYKSFYGVFSKWYASVLAAVKRAQPPPTPTTQSSTTVTTPAPTTTTPAPLVNVRIPLDLYPIKYKLVLRPSTCCNISCLSGSVQITMKCLQRTDTVYLHMKNISIDKDSLSFGSTSFGISPDVRSWTLKPELDFVIFKLTGQLQKGEHYFISMNFTTNQTRQPIGLFYDSIQREGRTSLMAATFSKPIYARRIFPCFDEPGIKATFDVTLEIKNNHYAALSTTEQVSREIRSDGYLAEVFHTTHPMSTYLLGMAVVKFGHTAAVTNTGYTFTMWMPNFTIGDAADHAFNDGMLIFKYFNQQIFEVRYPFKKLDLLVSPRLSANGMESWGLMMFKEDEILFKNAVSPASEKQRITALLARKISQQWFGNLVGLTWWDDLWLYEGFATLMEYIGSHYAHPDWNMLDQFVPNVLHQALDMDGLMSSKPVYLPVRDPDDLPGLFVTLSQTKGASIIRMMDFFLGPNVFRRGLTIFFNEFRFGSASHNDLWYAMANITHADGNRLDVKGIMDTWILQKNYPVINVRKNGRGLVFNQQRFISKLSAPHPDEPISPFGYTWRVPITFTHSGAVNFDVSNRDVVWMPATKDELFLPVISLPTAGFSWYLVNVKQYGYYRVNYDQKNWQNIISLLRTNRMVIHSNNRAQLVGDSFSLASAGHLDMKVALQILSTFSIETDYIPWKAGFQILGYMNRLLSRHRVYGDFLTWTKELITPMFIKNGMNSTATSHFEQLSRSLSTTYACLFQLSYCVKEATRLFREWMANPDINPIDPDLKESVYCTAIREGSESEWVFLYNRWRLDKNYIIPEAKIRLKALACTEKHWLINRYVWDVINSEDVLDDWQYTVTAIVAISENPIGQNIIWDYFKMNYQLFVERFGERFFALEKMITGITSGFSTQDDIEKLERFMKSNQGMEITDRAFRQAHEKARQNQIWISNFLPSLQTWFETER